MFVATVRALLGEPALDPPVVLGEVSLRESW